jgi:hypothetical protein
MKNLRMAFLFMGIVFSGTYAFAADVEIGSCFTQLLNGQVPEVANYTACVEHCSDLSNKVGFTPGPSAELQMCAGLADLKEAIGRGDNQMPCKWIQVLSSVVDLNSQQQKFLQQCVLTESASEESQEKTQSRWSWSIFSHKL